MRFLGLLGILIGCTWACSSESDQSPSAGGAAGLGAGGTATAPSGAGATAHDAGASGTSDNGTSGASDGGAGDASDNGTSGASNGGAGDASDNGTSGASDGGAGGTACFKLSSFGQATTLAQLVGQWSYSPYVTDDVEYYLDFQTDGTGDEGSWEEDPGGHGTFEGTDSGTFEVTADQLILHATKHVDSNLLQGQDIEETIVYDYAYDAASDALYAAPHDLQDANACYTDNPPAYKRFLP